MLIVAKDCGQLDAPSNGEVSVGTTLFGDTANYTCKNGYELIGVTSRVCQVTGKWKDSTPICRGY